jgi:hypothetical protein
LSIAKAAETQTRLGPLEKLEIKIDQSFVRQITTVPDETIIVEAVISMGRSLKLRVIAKGVETQEHWHFFRLTNVTRHKATVSADRFFLISSPICLNQPAGSREVRSGRVVGQPEVIQKRAYGKGRNRFPRCRQSQLAMAESPASDRIAFA